MVARQRGLDAARRRADRLRRLLGDELRDKRLSVGLTQQQVAGAAGMSRTVYLRVEAGTRSATTLGELISIGAVLGLDLSVRLYPGGEPLRDAAQHRRLARMTSVVAPPLTYRTEVSLPPMADRVELRSWDSVIFGAGRRTAVEVEMRLHDGQALERRLGLKRRDDPTDAFLLLVADTGHNRRVLSDYPELFPDLPRLPLRLVLDSLRAGQHPPTGLALL